MGYFYAVDNTEELEHHGIKGQKWGVRRFQNVDGSLTSKGKSRYGDSDGDAHSVRAAGHRALAKVYSVNENFYSKHTNNKALASMNAIEKNRQLKKAEEAQKAANSKKQGKINEANAKREEKLTKYRDKQAENAKNRSEWSKNVADQAKYEMNDLKKYGTKSSTYKAWDANQRLKDANDTTLTEGQKAARLFMRGIESSAKVGELISEKNNTYKKYSENAKNWMRASENVMNTPVSEFSSKRDVRKALRSSYANS